MAWELVLLVIEMKKVKIVATALFILSMIPLVWIGMYARPSMDDYSFTASSSFYHHMQWWDTERDEINYFERSVRYARLNGNIIDVTRNVFRTVADNYREWQGTFSAIALFSLQPAVLFGHGAYPLVMLVTLLPLILASVYLMYSLFNKEWLLPSLIILTACIQFMPHVGQGLFWYNGAIFYTFFFSLMLISIGLKVHLRNNSKKWHIVIIALLDFFITGGNLVTALLLVEINILFAIGTRKKVSFIYLFSSALGLFLNVIAPGNVIRSGGFGGFSYVISTIIQSLITAVTDIIQWTTIPVMLLLFLSIPLMCRIIIEKDKQYKKANKLMWKIIIEKDEKKEKENNFRFQYPLLVIVITFLLFASQNAPPFFGMTDSGPPRLRNIVYFSYVWLIFGNTFYILGWVINRFIFPRYSVPVVPSNLRLSKKDIIALRKERDENYLNRRFITYYNTKIKAGLVLLFLAVVVWGYPNSSSYMASRDIREGRATEFMQQHRERQAILNSNPADGIVRINAFNNPPFTLIPWWDGVLPLLDTEVSINSTGFVNRAMADFYGLVAVYSNPPRETVAMPVPTYFSFEGRLVKLETYLINWNRHIRLRDLALFLENIFDVQMVNDQLIINMGYSYVFNGSENATLAEENKVAFLNSEKILVLNSASDTLNELNEKIKKML